MRSFSNEKGTRVKTGDTKPFNHSVSTFDSFLEEEGILEEVDAAAVRRVMAWQSREAAVTAKQLPENPNCHS
jgi:hypothetical protein